MDDKVGDENVNSIILYGVTMNISMDTLLPWLETPQVKTKLIGMLSECDLNAVEIFQIQENDDILENVKMFSIHGKQLQLESIYDLPIFVFADEKIPMDPTTKKESLLMDDQISSEKIKNQMECFYSKLQELFQVDILTWNNKSSAIKVYMLNLENTKFDIVFQLQNTNDHPLPLSKTPSPPVDIATPTSFSTSPEDLTKEEEKEKEKEKEESLGNLSLDLEDDRLADMKMDEPIPTKEEKEFANDLVKELEKEEKKDDNLNLDDLNLDTLAQKIQQEENLLGEQKEEKEDLGELENLTWTRDIDSLKSENETLKNELEEIKSQLSMLQEQLFSNASSSSSQPSFVNPPLPSHYVPPPPPPTYIQTLPSYYHPPPAPVYYAPPPPPPPPPPSPTSSFYSQAQPKKNSMNPMSLQNKPSFRKFDK